MGWSGHRNGAVSGGGSGDPARGWHRYAPLSNGDAWLCLAGATEQPREGLVDTGGGFLTMVVLEGSPKQSDGREL